MAEPELPDVPLSDSADAALAEPAPELLLGELEAAEPPELPEALALPDPPADPPDEHAANVIAAAAITANAARLPG